MDRTRRQQVLDLRIAAARLASRHASTPAIGITPPRDEALYCTHNYLASFTKGLPHDVHSGLLQNPRHYAACRQLAQGAGAAVGGHARWQ